MISVICLIANKHQISCNLFSDARCKFFTASVAWSAVRRFECNGFEARKTSNVIFSEFARPLAKLSRCISTASTASKRRAAAKSASRPAAKRKASSVLRKAAGGRWRVQSALL